MFHAPEDYRVVTSDAITNDLPRVGNNGLFVIPSQSRKKKVLHVTASNLAGWEHVSVNGLDAAPNPEDIALVKDLFWDGADLVVQIYVFHPEIEYSPKILHLWRKSGTNLFCELPNVNLVLL